MEAKPKPKTQLTWLVAGLLLIAYPLSLPPVAGLINLGYLPEAVAVVYRPIGFVLSILPEWAIYPYLWYWDQWGSLPDF